MGRPSTVVAESFKLELREGVWAGDGELEVSGHLGERTAENRVR